MTDHTAGIVLVVTGALCGTMWMIAVTWMLGKVWTFYCDMPDPPKDPTE